MQNAIAVDRAVLDKCDEYERTWRRLLKKHKYKPTTGRIVAMAKAAIVAISFDVNVEPAQLLSAAKELPEWNQ